MMPNWFRDLVGIWRATPEILRAQRLFAQARNLRREGRVVEGFRTAIEAFGILRADAHLENPAAQSLVATETVLVDELARQLGHPGAARDDLAVALKICEDVSSAVPRIQPQLKQYIDWYRHRLAELNPDVVH